MFSHSGDFASVTGMSPHFSHIYHISPDNIDSLSFHGRSVLDGTKLVRNVQFSSVERLFSALRPGRRAAAR